MTKNIILLTSCFLMTNTLLSQIKISDDKASNYSGSSFVDGSSQGIGFSTNYIQTSCPGTCGSYVGSSGQGDPSLALWSSNGVNNEVTRKFNSALVSGDVFSIDLGHSGLLDNNGSVGINLIDSNGNVLFTIKYTFGQGYWQLNNGGNDFNSGIDYFQGSSKTFTFTYNGGNNYDYTFGTDSGSNHTATNSLSDIKGFKVFSNSQGSGKNFGFNNVSVTSSSISGDISFTDLTIGSGETITINSSGSLNISNTLTNNGTIVMNSSSNEYSSLIAGSKAGSGTYTYNRYVASTSTFDLTSAPFTGQTFSDLLSNNSGVIYYNPSDGTQHVYGPFNNDSGAYVQYDSDTDGNQTMDAGLGFRTGTDSGATLAITGTFETSNVTEPISLGSHATYGRWNLIGNPFPSYLDLYDFFVNNALSGNFESGTYNAVYTYDGDDSNGSVWTIYNGNNSSGQYIAPGQAFFVASASSGHTVDFNTSWQSVSGGDDFLPGERRPNDDSFGQNASSSNSKISLALSFDGSKFAVTDIYLNTRASSGLDVGYDAGTFANQAGSLGLYSFLADGSHPETKLAIQAVSNNISDPVVIPIGINAQSGIDYTIKLKERPQQEGVFVYLKDKLDNSMTLLTDEDYSFNTSTDLQGDGRFEIHLSAFALSTFDISKAPYSMIGLRGKVQVTGELSKGDVITILDLRGRTLAKQTVNSPTQSATVKLNGVSKGVYIGKVENNIGQYNTKFILK